MLWIPLRLRDRARNELPQALPLTVDSHLHNLYLGAINDHDLRKCQDSGCFEWFRLGLRGTTGKYCPHPEDRKRDSRCANKGTSGIT